MEFLVEFEVTVQLGEGKRAKVNGATLRAAEQLRSEVATLVFTRGDQKITAEFVEDILVRYTVVSK